MIQIRSKSPYRPHVRRFVPTTRPSNNFEKILTAFTQLEKKDLCVERIVLTPPDYNQLVTEGAITDLRGRRLMGESWNNPNNEDRIDMFFGAGLELGPKSRVYSAPEFGDQFVNIFTVGLSIIVESRAEEIKYFPKNEQVAIETLREMITEKEYRRFIKYGFICVEGESGKTYQIFRRAAHIKVWQDGKKIEEICVSLRDKNIPLTDKLIAFKAMIETNEEDFKKLGNVYKLKKVA